jgi:hypothetical protein
MDSALRTWVTEADKVKSSNPETFSQITFHTAVVAGPQNTVLKTVIALVRFRAADLCPLAEKRRMQKR